MKKTTVVLVFLLGIISFSACEKDDICVDGDTPLLIIRFFDSQDITQTKEVPGLQVNGLIIGTDTLEILSNASLDSIALPLRVAENNTSFLISQQLGEDDPTNFDVLTFSYEVQEVFVSRACGFVANYDGLEGSASSEGDAPWINEIQIITPLVENSTAAHVKIFH
ncbi:DUF6452 family protein [Ulvibacterium sp.]|uniref:DUF6452 family protein n=1 Tax=Ulvibacterium sp. TaxID=2665914 RepID=UPI00260C9340|nr:DUF6452 family protein [Ulvibacterium sp.]